jgi:hypothetical protein
MRFVRRNGLMLQGTTHALTVDSAVCICLVRSQGSSGSIVSDYGLDDRAIRVRSPAEAKEFFL